MINVLPWLAELFGQYPKCRYLISSRPVGYPTGSLHSLGFAECDLLDFEDSEIRQYTGHWRTAIRLARNEPEKEARQEGAVDGAAIVKGFEGHPYIPNLAKNPLMLSAICLVNYFEGGQLPKDRPVLYKLCVEGLLHHWDQRRGIHSEFTLDEKLRVCRELAVTMQADDRAEYGQERVRQVFESVLGDATRGESLVEHVRFRTGLLLERRPGVFGFAHLTFQEYLSARAVHDGNGVNVDIERIAREHADGRWKEVIALDHNEKTTLQLAELMHLAHVAQSDILVTALASIEELYQRPGFSFPGQPPYWTQAEIALIGLGARQEVLGSGFEPAFFQILSVLAESIAREGQLNYETLKSLNRIIDSLLTAKDAMRVAKRAAFASLARNCAKRLGRCRRKSRPAEESRGVPRLPPRTMVQEAIGNLRSWASMLDSRSGSPRNKGKSKHGR